MKPKTDRRGILINALLTVLITGAMIGLVIGGSGALAQTDGGADTLGISEDADSPEPSDSIEGIRTEEGALGLDPDQVYDIPGEEYEDIEEDYGEEIIEEEEILDDYYEDDEGTGEEIPLEEIDPGELESPIEEADEEEELEFESEFEEYDVEETDSPGEEDDTIGTRFEEVDPGELESAEDEDDNTIGTQFEEIDPGELESAPEGVTAQ